MNTDTTEKTTEANVAQSLDTVVITDIEKSRVTELQMAKMQAAQNLANADANLALAKRRQEEALKAYLVADQTLQGRANLIAEGYGIDPTKPGWSFDPLKGEFKPIQVTSR